MRPYSLPPSSRMAFPSLNKPLKVPCRGRLGARAGENQLAIQVCHEFHGSHLSHSVCAVLALGRVLFQRDQR
eukprot:2037121-Pyramimonas_sp.AAC.1